MAQPGGCSLVVMCASLRKLSPVACECVAECLRHGHEVCAPGSYGCQFPWKHEARRFSKRKGTADTATRAEYVEARLGKLAESVAARVEQLHDEEDELAARRGPAEHKDLRHARVP